jgi:hypothetical protein
VHWIKDCILYVDRIVSAVEKAKEIGTYGADDRSAQYPLLDQKLVRKAINECWTKVHQLETAGKQKDLQIAELRQKVKRYRWANIALTSVITGLAWEGLKALLGFWFTK